MQAKEKLGKNKQREPKKYMLRKNPPSPTSPPTLASSIAIFIHLLVFNAVIIIFPAKSIVQFLWHLILCEGHFKQSLLFSLPTLGCF